MPESNTKIGPPLFYIGLIVIGIASIIGFAIPPIIFGLWAIFSGFLLILNR